MYNQGGFNLCHRGRSLVSSFASRWDQRNGGSAMNDIGHWLQLALGIGLDNQEMTFWQIALRAVIVYMVTLAMVLLGKKRFMGEATAFVVILGSMLFSIVSQAITGNAPLVPPWLPPPP